MMVKIKLDALVIKKESWTTAYGVTAYKTYILSSEGWEELEQGLSYTEGDVVKSIGSMTTPDGKKTEYLCHIYANTDDSDLVILS